MKERMAFCQETFNNRAMKMDNTVKVFALSVGTFVVCCLGAFLFLWMIGSTRVTVSRDDKTEFERGVEYEKKRDPKMQSAEYKSQIINLDDTGDGNLRPDN